MTAPDDAGRVRLALEQAGGLDAATLNGIDIAAAVMDAHLELGPRWRDADDGTLALLALRQCLAVPAWTPCPAWCDAGEGHPFDNSAGTLLRTHAGGRQLVGSLEIVLEQTERSAAPTGPSIWAKPTAAILMRDDVVAELTIDEARATAVAIAAIAEKLEQIDVADR